MSKLIWAAGLTLLIAVCAVCSAEAQNGWPVDAQNGDHPIGNSFGEFQDFGGVYGHTGIDILAVPYTDGTGAIDASAEWTRVTVGGTVTGQSDQASTLYNGTTISGTDGTTYRYWHLSNGSYDTNYVNNFNNGTAVAAGDQIARVVNWSCSYHHLHYDLSSGSNYLNPMAAITPNTDAAAPTAPRVEFAQDNSNPWVHINPVAAGACPEVSGNVDVVAEVNDTDDAGSTLAGADTAWVRNVRWRACPESSPNCAWQNTWTFDNMPTGWGSGGSTAMQAYYSNRTPWDSSSNYCAATSLYGVVTNFSAGTPNTAGTWATAGLANGAYSVSVEATDFAGNITTGAARACVRNGGGCATELTMRDASDDTGAVPYPGGNWWLSPDITVNPGTADEDTNIHLDSANPIDVRVWNYGSCSLAAGATYTVCLGWSLPTGSVPYPLPAGQQIECRTETVPAGGWAPGSAQTTTFTWTPNAADVPDGHHCLVAWTDLAADGVQNTPAVNWDDNRAQQNIMFVAPPAPGAPGAAGFYVYPQEMLRRRALQITFEWTGKLPRLTNLELVIGPELAFETVEGGKIVATTENGDRIIGGIDMRRGLRLTEVRVRKLAKVVLQGIGNRETEDDKSVFSAHVMEFGLLPDQKEVAPVGGLTLEFSPVAVAPAAIQPVAPVTEAPVVTRAAPCLDEQVAPTEAAALELLPRWTEAVEFPDPMGDYLLDHPLFEENFNSPDAFNRAEMPAALDLVSVGLKPEGPEYFYFEFRTARAETGRGEPLRALLAPGSRAATLGVYFDTDRNGISDYILTTSESGVVMVNSRLTRAVAEVRASIGDNGAAFLVPRSVVGDQFDWLAFAGFSPVPDAFFPSHVNNVFFLPEIDVAHPSDIPVTVGFSTSYTGTGVTCYVQESQYNSCPAAGNPTLTSVTGTSYQGVQLYRVSCDGRGYGLWCINQSFFGNSSSN